MSSLVYDIVGSEFLQVSIKIFGSYEEVIIKDGAESLLEYVHFVDADSAHLGVVHVLVKLVVVVLGGQHDRRQQQPELVLVYL